MEIKTGGPVIEGQNFGAGTFLEQLTPSTVPRSLQRTGHVCLGGFCIALDKPMEAKRFEARPAGTDYGEQLGPLFEQTNDAVFLIGMDGRFIAANRRAAALLGYAGDELVGMRAQQFIVPEERAAALSKFERLLEDQQNPLYERTMITKDGTPIPTEIDAALVRDPDGTPRYIQSVVRNISTRKAEEERRRLVVEGVSAVTGEDLFRTLVRHFAAVLRVKSAFVAESVDDNGTVARTIAFWRDGEFIRNFEYDVAGTPCERVLQGEVRLHSERVQELFPDDQDLVDLGAVGYLGIPLHDSRKHGVIGHLVAIDDKPLSPDAVSQSLLKIFASRAGAEVERRHIEDQLLQARKMESVGLLAGGIAHDFNNLLMGILGALSLAKNRVDNGSHTHDLLNDAERAGNRAKRLTQQLLTLAKGGAPIRRPTAITELIRESSALALIGTSVRAEYDIANGIWAADADAGQIGQVIENLVINAVHAMPHGGIIHIAANNVVVEGRDGPLTPGRYVCIEVRDEGTGISSEQIGRVFDPYFTTKKDGTGLGLATSYAIVSKHEGHLGARSAVGHGSTFTIHLPAHSGRPARPVVRANTPQVKERRRILVMDDEEMVRNVVQEMLTDAGYEVELATDGDAAAKAYREARDGGTPFDAVILDLTVRGGVGGKEAMRKLLDIDPEARGIVCSGYSDDPIMAEFESHGFRGRIAKPFVPPTLMTALGELLDG
jgi:PAS domain S-box-containing protein